MDVAIVIATAWASLVLLGRILMAASAKGESPPAAPEPRRLRLTTIERRPDHPVRARTRVLS